MINNFRMKNCRRNAPRVDAQASSMRLWLALSLLVAVMAGGAGRLTAQAGGQSSSGQSSAQGSGSMNSDTPAPSSSSVASANQSMLYPGEDFKLSPGDLIAVRVFLQPEYEATVRVSASGTVQLPFIGSVPVMGLKVREAQALIADRLRIGQFYKDPEVTIQVMNTVNGSVRVTGEVHAEVLVANEMSLRDVLLNAGGLPATASHTVKIVRPGVAEPIVVDLGTDLAASAAANIPIRPHDTIQISRASVVYVLGAFAHQGPLPLDQASPLTLLQLAALSGGINFEGKFEDLRLIRTIETKDGPQCKVIEVDIKKVRDGKEKDPILQANDIVFLPTNSVKAILKSLGPSGVLGVVSILIATRNF